MIFDPGSAHMEDIVWGVWLKIRQGRKWSLAWVSCRLILTLAISKPNIEATLNARIILQEQLAAIEDEYDIIFSIVPEYFAGLAMRYFSSHEINVPSNPNALSLIGFTLLVDKLGKFH